MPARAASSAASGSKTGERANRPPARATLRTSSAVRTVPPPASTPDSFARASIVPRAPGVVRVISRAPMPPRAAARQAPARFSPGPSRTARTAPSPRRVVGVSEVVLVGPEGDLHRRIDRAPGDLLHRRDRLVHRRRIGRGARGLLRGPAPGTVEGAQAGVEGAQSGLLVRRLDAEQPDRFAPDEGEVA